MLPNVKEPQSLRSLSVRGSIWTLAGHGGVMAIRMGRTLIMTRLLFPEVYGLMVLVWAVLYGLQMFADTGITTTIIRDPRGDDPDFLNTAFTTNVIRGVLLWLVSCAIAYPLAVVYHQPALAQLLPATGLTAIVHGLVSTAIYTRRRHMDFRRLAIMDLATEVVMTLVLILWAYLSHSVWSLVGGAVIAQIFMVVVSHVYLPGIRNRFRWDRTALTTFTSFGKWIYLSSVVYFLSTQSDRFILGKYLDLAQLGVYGTATGLAAAILAVINKINSDVLFPAYSRVVQQGTEKFRAVLKKTRLVIDIAIVLPLAVVMMLGIRIIDLLYDSRYHDAGWMFQILTLRLLVVATLSNNESCLTALGHPKYLFFENVCRVVAIAIAIPAGWWLAGVRGVIWAVALSELLPLVIIWSGMIRYRVLSVTAELRSVLFAAAGALLGFVALQALP